MAADEPSLEFQAMRKHHEVLVIAVGTMCSTMTRNLFSENLITEDVKDKMNSSSLTDKNKAEVLVDCVRDKVKLEPKILYEFIKLLKIAGSETAGTLETTLEGNLSISRM